MNYLIVMPAGAGDIMPLKLIAISMAQRDAAAGPREFYDSTYRGRLFTHQSVIKTTKSEPKEPMVVS